MCRDDDFFCVCCCCSFFLSLFVSVTLYIVCYSSNQFNNRIVQSFILCHNLIKIRNSHRIKARGKTENAKYMLRTHGYAVNERDAHTIYTIIDCSMFTSLVFCNKSMCIFLPFSAFSVVLNSITFYVIIYKMFKLRIIIHIFHWPVWSERMDFDHFELYIFARIEITLFFHRENIEQFNCV